MLVANSRLIFARISLVWEKMGADIITSVDTPWHLTHSAFWHALLRTVSSVGSA